MIISFPFEFVNTKICNLLQFFAFIYLKHF